MTISATVPWTLGLLGTEVLPLFDEEARGDGRHEENDDEEAG